LALLPDDRLLCDDGHEILLFDLNDAFLTTLPPTQRNQPPRQQAVACLPFSVRVISQPFLVNDSIRFIVLTHNGAGKGVKGLIIPLSTSASHNTMEVVDLLSGPIICRNAHLGYHRAVVCSAPEPTMLQYAWPEEHASLSLSSTIQTPYCTHILFDDYSSRLISCGVGSTIDYILDLAAL